MNTMLLLICHFVIQELETEAGMVSVKYGDAVSNEKTFYKASLMVCHSLNRRVLCSTRSLVWQE
jgi:hypothetical protein